MEPEQAAREMGQTDVLVVFKCGHWEVNPKKRISSTGRICAACGKNQAQDYVYIKCRECARPVKCIKSTRQLCDDCYAANQRFKSHQQRRNTLALNTPDKFMAGPGDTQGDVATAIGVSKQRVQQIEARASRTVKQRWALASKKRGRKVYEGFVFLDGQLMIGPRSVVGVGFDDAAAELLIDFWEHCCAARVSIPDIERVNMSLFPVSDVFVRPVVTEDKGHDAKHAYS